MLSQTLDSFGAMLRKNLLIMLRYPVNFISSFAQVLIIILIMLFASLSFIPGGVQNALLSQVGRTFSSVAIYGLILFLFVSDTLWSVGYNIRWEQYEGTLESLYLTPANRFLHLVSRLFFPIVWTGLNATASLAFMRYIFGPLPLANPGLALLTLALTLAGVFGFGFCFAAYTLIVKESAQTVANMLQFALMAVCAMFFPFAVLPAPVRAVSYAVPLSYGVDLFRSALMGFPPGYPELLPVATEIVIVALWGLLMPTLGFLVYRWAETYVRTNGSLAEF